MDRCKLFEGEFQDMERCPNCRWTGKREELIRGKEVERYHPRNRSGIVHSTEYEKCPRCGKWIYADGSSL